MAARDSQVVEVDGHRLTVTNLDKVMYPSTGTTKADVFAYYAGIAPVLLPHAEFRPATRKRWVHGVGTADAPGSVFFQKDIGAGVPDWVPRAVIEHSDGPKTYPLVNNAAVLAWFAQIAALEIHVPQWRFTHDGVRRNPDRLVLDLDPGQGAGLPECAEVARLARRLLEGMGLAPLPVTSGSKGIHLYAQLDERSTSDQVASVAHELARALEADHPDLVVSDMKKALRGGKVLVDWSQNNGSKTTIAPYSLRGRLRPTVAAPRTWEELDDPGLRQLEYPEVLERVRSSGDPLGAIDAAVGPTPGARDAAWVPSARGADAGGKASDRLSTYRGKRDPAKTPEPVPHASPASTDGHSFVIQEHHARRLHYDFRLEHDGVLVSWALPKGVPTDPGRNHLAVQTEDHPLEYGSFEGTIPKGEYGGGTVRIWDSGSYELEKWRETEIIVTLHGQVGGGLGEPVRVALIRTRVQGGKADWLIHRMKAQTASAAATSTTVEVRRHRPMLAQPGGRWRLDEATPWSIEMKWDGIRAIATVTDDGAVALASRRGNDLTMQYPELAALAEHAPPGVYDGEIVALDAAGRPSFARLQTRMNLTRPGEVRAAAARQPVRLLLFDVLELEGRELTGLPYRERRRRLLDAMHEGAPIAVPEAFDGDVAAALETSRLLGLEGIVAKDADSRYDEGTRSGSWIKLKHSATQEAVIGGWHPGRGARADTFGSLLIGIPDGDRLRYIGKVGTGFDDAALDSLSALLRPLAADSSPFIEVPPLEARDAHWVLPRLVGEVRYGEWTPAGILRHPVWRGLRPDKAPEEVVAEASEG